MWEIINYEERQNKIEYHNSKFIMRKLKNVSFLDYETKTVPNIYTYEEFNLDIEDLIGRMIWFSFFFISILSIISFFSGLLFLILKLIEILFF